MRLEHDEFSCPPSPTGLDGGHPVADSERLNAALELSRKIAASGLQNDAFLLANEDQLVANCQWAQDFPYTQPYFDVSCNACPWLLKALSDLKFKFACQSKVELQHVLAQGIEASSLYFASPTKVASHMKFASSNKIPLMSFGSFNELKKIQKAAPDTGLLLPLQTPTGHPETDRQWLDLLNAAKDLGLNVMGVSFDGDMLHQGHFNKMMALTRMAFSIGHSLGHSMKIVNVGNALDILDKDVFGRTVRQHLDGLPDFQIMAHFGVSFIENVFSCGAKVIGKRVAAYQQQNTLVINDGIFSSFRRSLVDEKHTCDNTAVMTLNSKNREETDFVFDVFGSSGDDLDVVAQDLVLGHNVEEEDWLFFANMGAFSIGANTNMKSIKLPGKFGNFWLFSPDDQPTDDDDPRSSSPAQELKIEDILAGSQDDDADGLEVVFLDIQGMTNEQQACLNLFEELPSFAGYETDDAKFWDEIYSAANIR